MQNTATRSSRTPLATASAGLKALRRILFVTITVTFAAAGLSNRLEAQNNNGRIVGRVTDAESGRGLVGARVALQGTSVATQSGIDGRYSLSSVPAGSHTLMVSYIGYSEKMVTDLETPPDGALSFDVSMSPAAVSLAGITVTAVQQGSISRALDEQRSAVGVISAVTSEQIARSPDSDAAAAVQRVSGVSVQDGRYVFVRGLGERYTTTSLNGSRIPSPEPEKKMVPLDLFPSGLIQSITTSKTFTPNLPGDFSGAQVDIQTREFPAQRQVTYSYTAGFNPGVTGKTLTAAPRAGGEWMALAADPRRIPSLLDSRTSFEGIGQRDYNDIVRSFRNSWSVDQQKAMPSTSMSASVGGNDPLFGQRIGYLASATYSINQDARLDEVRAIALPGMNPAETREVSRYEGDTGRTSVLWGGLVNMSTLFGSSSRISLNGSYNRSADNDGRRERGVDENTGADLRIDRLQYVERGVFSGQLQGEHQFGQSHRFDWSLNSSSVSRSEPDRSEVVYLIERNAAGTELPAAWALSGNEVAVRTFADLQEDAQEASANYRLSLGSPNRPLDLVVGGLARNTRREADNRAWSVQSLGSNALTRDRTLREQAPEAIFGDAFTRPEDSIFSVVPISEGGSYNATDRLFAGYGMVEWMLSNELQLVTGARIEHSKLELEALSTIREEYKASPTYTDILPALTLNLALNDEQNLRFSVSQTLARPEYREIAPVQYREVIGGENTRGNADLRRTLIQNIDLRWELYPEADEALSIALFAKRFKDPIERIYLATSGTAINSFVNAAGADNYGIEIEARKGLRFISDSLEPFSVFTNATLMRSEIRIGNEGLASTTNPDRPMLGQSPYVINAGASYASRDNQTSATLLYNVVGKRIVAAAGAPLPDVYEMAQPALDLSFRFPLFAGMSGKLDAKNLLDSAHELRQGDVTREYYRTGRSFSLGATVRR